MKKRGTGVISERYVTPDNLQIEILMKWAPNVWPRYDHPGHVCNFKSKFERHHGRTRKNQVNVSFRSNLLEYVRNPKR